MFSLLKETVLEFTKHDCVRMAAALAYYTAFSLAPILILTLTVAGFVFDAEDLRGDIADQVSTFVGPSGVEEVKQILETAKQPKIRGWASVLGIAGLLFGASGVVVQLQSALNEAWEVQPDPKQGGIWTLLRKRIFSIAMVLGVGFVMVVSLALSSLTAAFERQIEALLPVGKGWIPWLTNNVGTLLLLVVLFAAIFKIIPDAKVRWKDVTVGALLTAVLFVIGKQLISLYLGTKSMESTFGAAGSLALLLLWAYYSSMILLFGAEFTQVYAEHRGHAIVPVRGAVHIRRRVDEIGKPEDKPPEKSSEKSP